MEWEELMSTYACFRWLPLYLLHDTRTISRAYGYFLFRQRWVSSLSRAYDWRTERSARSHQLDQIDSSIAFRFFVHHCIGLDWLAGWQAGRLKSQDDICTCTTDVPLALRVVTSQLDVGTRGRNLEIDIEERLSFWAGYRVLHITQYLGITDTGVSKMTT